MESSNDIDRLLAEIDTIQAKNRGYEDAIMFRSTVELFVMSIFALLVSKRIKCKHLSDGEELMLVLYAAGIHDIVLNNSCFGQ